MLPRAPRRRPCRDGQPAKKMGTSTTLACLPARSLVRSFALSLAGWLACLLVGWSLGRALRVSFGREPLNSRRRLAARSSLRTHSRPTFQRALHLSLWCCCWLPAGKRASSPVCSCRSSFLLAQLIHERSCCGRAGHAGQSLESRWRLPLRGARWGKGLGSYTRGTMYEPTFHSAFVAILPLELVSLSSTNRGDF